MGTASADFREAARLLVQLHQFIAAGKGESEEADAVRDEIDPLWERFAAGERQLFHDLSADLYILEEAVAERR